MTSVAVKKEYVSPERIEALLPEAQCWTVCNTRAPTDVIFTEKNEGALNDFYTSLKQENGDLKVEVPQDVEIHVSLPSSEIRLAGFIQAPISIDYVDRKIGIKDDEGKRLFSYLEKYHSPSKKGSPCKKTNTCRERDIPDQASQGTCFCIRLKDIKLSGSIEPEGEKKRLSWKRISAQLQEADEEGAEEEEERNDVGKEGAAEEQEGGGVLELPVTQCWSLKKQGRSKLVLREANANAVKEFLRNKKSIEEEVELKLPEPKGKTINSMKMDCTMRLYYSEREFPILCRLIAESEREGERILLVVQNSKDLYTQGENLKSCSEGNTCEEVDAFRADSRCIFLSNIQFREASETTNTNRERIIKWKSASSVGHTTPPVSPQASALREDVPARPGRISGSGAEAMAPSAAKARQFNKRPRWRLDRLSEPIHSPPGKSDEEKDARFKTSQPETAEKPRRRFRRKTPPAVGQASGSPGVSPPPSSPEDLSEDLETRLKELLERKLPSLQEGNWNSILGACLPTSRSTLLVEQETSSRVVYEAVMKIFYERLELFKHLDVKNQDLLLREPWEVPLEQREVYLTLQAAADVCAS